jgi:P-type conjugative transfer protein TrbJ
MMILSRYLPPAARRILAAAAMLIVVPATAQAQWITTDVSNLVAMSRNFFQLKSQIDEARRQYVQLRRTYDTMRRDYRRVQRLTGWQGIGAIEQVDGVFARSDAVMYDISDMEGYVMNLYPVEIAYEDYRENQRYARDRTADTYMGTMQAQSEMRRDMDETSTRLNDLATKIQGAEGNLDAQQMQMNLGLLQAGQMMKLRSQIMGLTMMEAVDKRSRMAQEEQTRRAWVEGMQTNINSTLESLRSYDPPPGVESRRIGRIEDNPLMQGGQ